GRQQVVDQVGSTQPSRNSEMPSQSTKPQLDEPSDPSITGKVKWFNPEKRYGFVELSDGSGDAFLHASVLERLGIGVVQPGETLAVRVAQGQRGFQVTEVIAVDTSTRAAFEVSPTGFGSASVQSSTEASTQETGTVKWYSVAKRFGFIVREDGGK